MRFGFSLPIVALVLFASGVGTGPKASESNRGPSPAGSEHWSKPQRIAPKSLETGSSDVAFDDAGNAYVAWAGSGNSRNGVYDPGTLQVPMVAVRSKGSRAFGHPQLLSHKRAGPIRLAVATDGAAVAVWGLDSGIQYSVRPPGGEFGPPVTFARNTDYGPAGFDVQMAADGSALITWDDAKGTSIALYRLGEGPFRPVPGFRAQHSLEVLGAVNQRGDMALLWETNRRHYRPTKGFVLFHESTLKAGSATFSPGRVVTDSQYDLSNAHIRLILTSLGESVIARGYFYRVCPLTGQCTPDLIRIRADQKYPTLLIADNEGNVHAFWQIAGERPFRGRKFLHSVRRSGGTFSTPTLVARARGYSFLDEAAVGPAGTLLLGWTSLNRSSASFTSRYTPEAGWEPPLRVTPTYKARGRNYSYVDDLSLGVAPAGNSLAAWEVAHRSSQSQYP